MSNRSEKFREDLFSSSRVTLLTDRQTAKQTHTGEITTSFAELKNPHYCMMNEDMISASRLSTRACARSSCISLNHWL